MPIVCPLEDLKLTFGPKATYPIMELGHTCPQMLIGILGLMHSKLVVLALVN
jgi:hypothetical protein